MPKNDIYIIRAHIYRAVTMAKIRFLTILLTATCFLGCVVSATDNEFEVHNVFCAKHLLQTFVTSICSLAYYILNTMKIIYTYSTSLQTHLV